VAAGLNETRPMPFVRGAESGFVRVDNPIASDESYLRRYLLDTLERAAERNLAHMHRDVRLFEIGSAFSPGDGTLPTEEMRVAALVMGHRRPPHFTEPKPPDFDEWDAKALADLIARAAFPGGEVELVSASPDFLWKVMVAGAYRGVVLRSALDAPAWAAPAFGIEITLLSVANADVAAPGSARYDAAARAAAAPGIRYRPIPLTPSTYFDLALLVPNDLPSARVEGVMRKGAGELLERLEVLSEFRGAGVPAGARSIAWRLTLRHPERTLQEKEIAGRRDKVLKLLESELDVRQRTT